MSIDKNECLELFSGDIPAFRGFWEDFLTNKMGTTEFNACTVCMALTRLVVDMLKDKNNSTVLKKIFNRVEFLIISGDEDVQTGVTTCFLENLTNSVDDKFPASLFVPFLGKESLAYCKAWDVFMGAPTPGLWIEGEWPPSRNR